MNRNTAKIKAGIRALTHTPHELISGTVVAGSVDTTAYTMSVQKSDGSEPITGVMLNAITGDANGLILFPKDNSNVIIGSIDGQGEWALIKASKITKAIITIENVTYEIDGAQVNIQNGNVIFNIGADVFKMNTGSESLFQLLNDMMTAITTITYTNGSGAAALTPASLPTITNLQTRLGNLLQS